jgi:hypothetical protein
LKADQLALFADNLYKNAADEMKKARFEHNQLQKNCKSVITKLSSHEIIFEQLLNNITIALNLSNSKIESNNNKKTIIEARLNEINKHYNRNEILRNLWLEYSNKTKIILRKGISQIKHFKNGIGHLKFKSKKEQAFIEIDPSNHHYKKLRSIMLDISTHEAIHHHGFNTAIKSIVHVIKTNMKLNKRQIKLIKTIIEQYKSWAKEFIENLEGKTKTLAIFYEKYKNNLNFHKLLLNKEKSILEKKETLYNIEKKELYLVYSLQSKQLNVLKEVLNNKKELCEQEKKKFKYRMGSM